ncbi:hypothetical protein GCM10020331_057950 [Ectobacillus funiculus]
MYNLALEAAGFLIFRGGIVYNLSKNNSAKQKKNKEVERIKTAAANYSSGTAKNSSTHQERMGVLFVSSFSVHSRRL